MSQEVNGVASHTFKVVKTVCQQLGINFGDMQGVLAALYSMEGDDFRRAKTEDGTPFFPCVALTGNHCVLLNWTKGKRKFSYHSLTVALEESAKILG